jgi:hypothetical protein
VIQTNGEIAFTIAMMKPAPFAPLKLPVQFAKENLQLKLGYAPAHQESTKTERFVSTATRNVRLAQAV